MTRRVFLHIGLPKTGTTFIQTTMWHNRPLLRAQGMLYPGRRRMDHHDATVQVRRRDGAPTTGPQRPRLQAWDRLLAEWHEAPEASSLLVSHEFFSLCTAAQAQRVVDDLAGAEVTVVMTVRAYVRQFPAVWQEALKMGDVRSLDDFMDGAFTQAPRGAWSWRSQSIPDIVSRWASAVPPERLRIVTVPPPGSSPDLLWQRWCAAVEIDDTGFDRDLTFSNESLGAQQAALMRRVQGRVGSPLQPNGERHRWVRGYLGHEVLLRQRGDRFAVRPHHAEELARRAGQAVEAVRAGGYQVYGDLQDLLAPPPTGTTHPDDVSAEEVLDVAADAIAQMVADVRELTLERDALRRRAERTGTGRARRLGSRVRRRLLAGRRSRRDAGGESS